MTLYSTDFAHSVERSKAVFKKYFSHSTDFAHSVERSKTVLKKYFSLVILRAKATNHPPI
jgi:hypothetical protein